MHPEDAIVNIITIIDENNQKYKLSAIVGRKLVFVCADLSKGQDIF